MSKANEQIVRAVWRDKNNCRLNCHQLSLNDTPVQCRTHMAKIIPMDLLSSLSGKVCGHSDISFAKKGKTQYTMKRCNPRTTPYTEAELVRQEKFAQVRANIKALSEEQKAEYAAQFKTSPGKYTTLNGYIFAQEYKKLV